MSFFPVFPVRRTEFVKIQPQRGYGGVAPIEIPNTGKKPLVPRLCSNFGRSSPITRQLFSQLLELAKSLARDTLLAGLPSCPLYGGPERLWVRPCGFISNSHPRRRLDSPVSRCDPGLGYFMHYYATP